MAIGNLGEANLVITAEDRATGVLANVGAAASGLVGRLGKVAPAAAGVAGAAAVVGGKAVSDFASLEKALKEVEKTTGMNEKQMSSLQDRLKTLSGSEMPATTKELSGIAAAAGRMGVEGEDSLMDFTESVQKMATATDLSNDEAAQAFGRLSKVLDEPPEKMENLGSVMNELSNNMALSSSDIVTATGKSASSLENLGMKSEDVFGLNASLAEVSSSSQRAGNRLRRLAQEMLDPGKVNDLADALGMNVDEFKNMVREDPTGTILKMAKAMKEDDKSAEALRSTLSTTSRKALSDLSTNLDGAKKALGRAGNQMEENTSLQTEYEKAIDSTSSKFQNLRDDVLNLSTTIGESLAPAVNNMLDGLGQSVEGLDKFIQKAQEGKVSVEDVKQAIVNFAGEMRQELVNVLNNVADSLNQTDFQKLGRKVVNTIGDLIISLWNGSGEGPSQKELAQAILDFVGAAVTALANLIRGATIGLDQVAEEILAGLRNWMSNNGPEKLGTAMANVIEKALQWMVDTATGGANRKAGVEILTDLAVTLAELAYELGNASTELAWSLINTLVQKAIEFIARETPKIVQRIDTWMQNVQDDVARGAEQWASELVNGLVQGAKQKWNRTQEIVTRIQTWFTETQSKIAQWVTQWVQEFIGGFVNEAKQKWQRTQEIVSRMKQWIEGIINDFAQWAVDMANELIGGFIQKAKQVWNRAQEVYQQIRDWAQRLITKFKEWGTQSGQDFIDKIIDTAKQAWSRAEELYQKIRDWAKKLLEDFVKWADDMANDVVDQFVKKAQEYWSRAEQVYQKIKDWLEKLWEDFVGWVESWVDEWTQTFVDKAVEWWNRAEEVYQTVEDWIKKLWDEFVKWVTDWVDEWTQTWVDKALEWWNRAEEVYQTIDDWLHRLWDNFVQWVTDWVDEWTQTWVDKAVEWWNRAEEVYKTIEDWLTGLWDDFVQWVTSWVDEWTQTWVDKAVEWWSRAERVFKTVEDWLKRLWEKFVGWVKTWVDEWITAWVDKASGDWDGAAKKVWTTIKNWFSDLSNNAVGWAKDMVDEFVDGIEEQIRERIDDVKDAADDVASYLGGSAPEVGPLYDAWKHGPEDFVDNYMDNLEHAVRRKNFAGPLFDPGQVTNLGNTGRSGGQRVVVNIDTVQTDNPDEFLSEVERRLRAKGV